jgi:hypothetical protein
MLRVSVAEGREGARQVSLSVADMSMNAAARNSIGVFFQPAATLPLFSAAMLGRQWRLPI